MSEVNPRDPAYFAMSEVSDLRATIVTLANRWLRESVEPAEDFADALIELVVSRPPWIWHRPKQYRGDTVCAYCTSQGEPMLWPCPTVQEMGWVGQAAVTCICGETFGVNVGAARPCPRCGEVVAVFVARPGEARRSQRGVSPGGVSREGLAPARPSSRPAGTSKARPAGASGSTLTDGPAAQTSPTA